MHDSVKGVVMTMTDSSKGTVHQSPIAWSRNCLKPNDHWFSSVAAQCRIPIVKAYTGLTRICRCLLSRDGSGRHGFLPWRLSVYLNVKTMLPTDFSLLSLPFSPSSGNTHTFSGPDTTLNCKTHILGYWPSGESSHLSSFFTSKLTNIISW